MTEKRVGQARLGERAAVEMLPGIFRTTLAYNEQLMLCHFRMRPGAVVPLHTHAAAQSGFVIRGRVRFRRGDGSSFVAEGGDGYVFDPQEQHGAEVLEETELIECFAPSRPEYV